MIDFKNTLINLHKKFPTYDLDTLIAIIDSIVETVDYNKFNYPYGTRYPLDLSKVVCENPSTWNDILNKNTNMQLKKEYNGPRISSMGRGTLSDEE